MIGSTIGWPGFRRPSRALRSSTSIPKLCWCRRRWVAASPGNRCGSPTSAFGCLRSTVRIEPADARWVKLLAGQDGRPFQTIDQTEIPVELELPETIDRLLAR